MLLNYIDKQQIIFGTNFGLFGLFGGIIYALYMSIHHHTNYYERIYKNKNFINIFL